MNLKEIKEIINLMNKNNLTEVEIEREGSKVKLRKSAPEVVVAHQPMVQRMEMQPTIVAPEKASSPDSSSTNRKAIVSPMVGTFYRAPSPESPPFVEMGQIVEVGQIVCIVEAMKLMNEIKSEVKGKIVEVSAENAEPVEFGQTLFSVEPV